MNPCSQNNSGKSFKSHRGQHLLKGREFDAGRNKLQAHFPSRLPLPQEPPPPLLLLLRGGDDDDKPAD